jgi:hypothetical protein
MTMPNTKLTRHQEDAMCLFRNYVGETIDVSTSYYESGVNPEFLKRRKGVVNSAALRGLEAKGYIKIEEAYWRGATVTVLKGMDA